MSDHAISIALDDVTITLAMVVMVPLFSAAAYVTHYFWKRARLVDTLVHRVEAYEADAERDRQTHRELYDRLNHIDRSLSRVLGYLEGPHKQA